MSRSVTQQFGRAARTYAQGVALHEAVADALLACVPWPGRAEVGRALDLGCGTGVLTERLRRAYPEACITAVDAAAGMTEATAARMRGDRALVCVTADARTFRPEQPVDLMASSSALHWMTPLPGTAAHLAASTRAGGALRAALMVRGTLGELHDLRRRLMPHSVPEAELPTVRAVTDAFRAAGWHLVSVVETTFHPRYASAAEFLRVLHAQGLTGGAVSHGRRLLTRGELRRLEAAYTSAFGDASGAVTATYRVLFMAGTR